jgi:hypothetical protein
VAFQLYAIANQHRCPAVRERVDRFVGSDQCPLSTGLRDASRNNSSIVRYQERDPDSGNCRDSRDSSHHQALVKVPHSESRLTRLGVWRSCGK